MHKNVRTSRKEKAVQTRNKIYESAEQLFNQHGFENVNVNDIVKHADVAKGSFYVHFESKDALIETLIVNYVKKVDANYKTYLDSLPSDLSPHEVFLSLISKIADVITDSIGYENMKILYRIQLGNERPTEAAMSYNRELYRIFHDVVQKGIEQGVFRSDLSAEDIARQFVVAYRGLTYEWCIRYPEFD